MEKISIEINIDENEVLRYLGYKGQKIEEELLLKIRDTIEEGKKLFAPKVIYKEYPINILENGVDVVGTTLVLEGNDIKKLSRSEGTILVLLYVVYLSYIIIRN